MTMYDDTQIVTLLRDLDVPVAPPDRLVSVRRRARRTESRVASVLATVLAVVMGAGALAAVNLGGRDRTETLSVAGAAQATVDAGSARVTMTLSFTGSSAPALGPGGYTLSGPVDFRRQRFALRGKFMGEAMELRGIGKDRWTSAPQVAGVTGRKWIHSTDESNGDGFETVDPARLLGVLTAKGEQISRERKGDRTVFVLRVAPDVLTPGASAEQGPQQVTVAVDDDGLVRSLEMTSEAGTSVEVKVRLEYDDFGIEVDVQPPPPDQVDESGSSGSISREESIQTFEGTSSSDPKQACAQLKSIQRSRPTPRTDQERQQAAQLDDFVKQVCAQK